jgi:hypothetical protein
VVVEAVVTERPALGANARGAGSAEAAEQAVATRARTMRAG